MALSSIFPFVAIISPVIYLYGTEINKLRPLAVGWSVGQMGQHSPKGISGVGHSLISSQVMSSQRTFPVSQTQIRQASGFHTSLSLYLCPSCTQLPASSVPEAKGKSRVRSQGGKNQGRGREKEHQCLVRATLHHSRKSGLLLRHSRPATSKNIFLQLPRNDQDIFANHDPQAEYRDL